VIKIGISGERAGSQHFARLFDKPVYRSILPEGINKSTVKENLYRTFQGY
jgi:hypothetical protein